MSRIRLKVCCISSVAEARLAIAHGADALGLVGKMPSGPGVIDDALIAEIARVVPPPVATFLLTSEVDAAAIVSHIRRTGVNTVQLVDEMEPEVYGEIRSGAPGVRVVQVIHVRDRDALGQAQRAAESVDALLLDSGNPLAAVRELGGTGRTHDWKISREIVERAGVPVFLAGGIRPDNVREAVSAVRPFGIDLCSGVRTNSALDGAKLDALVGAMVNRVH